MKKTKKLISVLLAVVMAALTLIPVFAADAPFDDGAYASVLTGSDFQDQGTEAYDRFNRLLTRMKNDGLETPDSMLVGGDYTKILFDYAVPGISLIRKNLVEVYPDADPDSVVCIQGNHDNISSGFAKTGFYDMGVYCLYVINEDDFPWLQGIRPGVDLIIKNVAKDMEKSFNAMIENGDMRPVIVMTHLPLHHTSRFLYSDNKYASYIFSALNKAAETLDVIFLFGHQHSDDYDDYIGGSVNFMAPGETILVPKPDKIGENAYTEETLNFTYANCGYVGYSNNNVTETSTNVLTLGVVRFSETGIRFVKYTEEGVYCVENVTRKNPGAGMENARDAGVSLVSEKLWAFEQKLFLRFFALLQKLLAMFSF
ncbi:MAG: metallophosphoesterase [Clostridia bacterium]|nr:metallophosphoesterase [Clostridia bacterium]